MKKLEEFIANFELPRDGFSAPTAFQDGYGFSTTKDRKQNGHDYASMYKFYINAESLGVEGNIKPVRASANYGKKLKDGSITLTSSGIKPGLNWPIEVYSTDDFSYDISQGEFYTEGKKISPHQVLLKLENWHTKPTKLFKGTFLRFKLFLWRILLAGSLKGLYSFLICVLRLLSGTRTTRSIWSINSPKDSFNEKTFEVEKESFATEKIDISGYKASAWSVVVYSLLHLLVYAVWFFNFRNSNLLFFTTLFKNAFLTVSYVIPTLVIFERLVPKILEAGVVSIGSLYQTVASRKVKI